MTACPAAGAGFPGIAASPSNCRPIRGATFGSYHHEKGGKMDRIVATLWSGDKGNSTVDWLVLTTGLVLLAAAVTAAVTPAPREIAQADDSTAASPAAAAADSRDTDA
jgi:hypothetical protein